MKRSEWFKGFTEAEDEFREGMIIGKRKHSEDVHRHLAKNILYYMLNNHELDYPFEKDEWYEGYNDFIWNKKYRLGLIPDVI